MSISFLSTFEVVKDDIAIKIALSSGTWTNTEKLMSTTKILAMPKAREECSQTDIKFSRLLRGLFLDISTESGVFLCTEDLLPS